MAMDLVVFGALGLSGIGLIWLILWRYARFSWLDKIVTAIVVSYPFERIPSLPVAGANLRFSQLFTLLGLLVMCVLLVKRDPDLLAKRLQAHGWWILAFLVLSIPSWFAVIDFRRFAVTMVATVIGLCTVFYVSNFAQKVPQKLAYLTWVMFGVGLFGVYQFVGDMLNLPVWATGLREIYTKDVFGIPRIHATALEPLYFAGMLFLPIFYCIFALLSNRFLAGNKWINLGLLAFFLGLLLLTISKSAIAFLFMMVLVAVLAVFGKFQVWELLKSISGLSLVTVAVLGVLFVGSEQVFFILREIWMNVLETLAGTSASAAQRNGFLEAALFLLPEFVLTGVGSGQYGAVGQEMLAHLASDPDQYLIVNNVYVEVLLEFGFLAFLAFLGLITTPIWHNIGWLRRSENWFDKTQLARLALIFSLVTYYLQWLTFSPVFIMPIFILLGLLQSLRAKNV